MKKRIVINWYKQLLEKDRIDYVFEIILKLDRIHARNKGKISPEEYILKLELSMILNQWKVTNKFVKAKRRIWRLKPKYLWYLFYLFDYYCL